MDVAIPIVFPDYRIAVDLKPTTIDIFRDWTWDNFKTPAYKDRWEGLGHAGVCFINGKTGPTKYFEYGRYDPAGLGWVQKHSIPDVSIRAGKIAIDSLGKALHRVAVAAGHSGRIQGVYIEVEGGFPLMLKYAELRMSQNHNATRAPYNLLTNSCVHFAKEVVAVAGIDTPWLLDPRPNSYIGEFRDDYPDLDYNPRTRDLKIQGMEEAA